MTFVEAAQADDTQILPRDNMPVESFAQFVRSMCAVGQVASDPNSQRDDELHISFEAVSGETTNLRFTFPEQERVQEQTRFANIIVVDKNSAWSQWAVGILRVRGYHVETQLGLLEVEAEVEQVHAHRRILIILGADLALKDANLVQRLAQDTSAPIRVLIVSPVRLPYYSLRALWKAGVSEIQPKPYDKYALLEMVAAELAIDNEAA